MSEPGEAVPRPQRPSPPRPSHIRLAVRLMTGAALGKALGFLREIEIARLLGASAITDSYRGAMTAAFLPLLPLLGDLVPSTVIMLHRRWQEEDRAARMQGALCGVFLGFGLAVAALLTVFAEPWAGLLLQGFHEGARQMTEGFIRVMALAAPALTLLACLAATELSLGRSRITVVRAAAQNIGVMAGIGIMALTGDVLALAWGFVLGNHAVMVWGGVRLWREGEISFAGLRPRPMLEAGRVFFRHARSLLAIPMAEQAHQFVERLLASGLASGTLASVDYARTLSESAQYLVSLPLGYAMLSRHAGARAPVRGRAEAVIVPMLALLVPASIFLALFAPDLVRVLLGRGAFGEAAVTSTAAALRGISAGLWAATLGWVLLSMVSAEARGRAALAVMVLGYSMNIGANLALAGTLGSLGIGLAEAARGLTVLVGSAAALGCLGVLGRRLLLAAPIAALLAVLGAMVHGAVAAPLPRLLTAAAVFGPGTLVWLGLALPEARRAAWLRLRRPRLA